MFRSTVTLALPIVVACALPASAQDGGKPLEVVHAYSTAGEVAALKVYRDEFVKEGGQWSDSAFPSGGAARSTTVRRVLGGDPPGAAQNQNKMVFGELLEGGYLRDVTAVAEAEKWKDVLSPGMWDAITYEGKVIAVPLQSQSQNFFYGNQAILDKVGITQPKTFDELFVAMDKIKAADPDIIPFAMAAEANDMRRLFTGTVASAGGKDLYTRVYVNHDPEAVKSPEFKKVAETFKRLKDYTDSSWATREWNDATNLVITGKAAFQIMGDWAKGALMDAGKQPGKDFQCTFLNDMVVASGNMMIFPKIDDEATAKSQELLAKVILMKDLQIPFAKAKGSIPTRTDVDTSSMDSCSQYAVAHQSNPETAVYDDNYSVTPQTIGGFEDLIKSYWSTPDMTSDQFAAKFAELIASEQ